MTRVRSPNYPAISLPGALERVERVFAKEHRHPMTREVAVKAMGYSGVNGASLSAISAMRKYGLLDRDGTNYRVSERALAILHPASPAEKAQLMGEAARAPELFVELLDNFPGPLPSDENLRSYLVRRGFSPSSLGGVIQAFRETMELAFPAGQEQNRPAPEDRAPRAREGRMQQTPALQTPASRIPAQISRLPPFSINIGPDGISGEFDIRSRESLKQMMRVLAAYDPLLPDRVDEPKENDPGESPESEVDDDL